MKEPWNKLKQSLYIYPHPKMASNLASNWKKEVTCVMCKHLLVDPKILPCLHSFCTRCIEKKWFEEFSKFPSVLKHHLQCPSCKSEVLLSTPDAIKELLSHFSAIRLVEIIRLLDLDQVINKKVTPICSNCKTEDNVAVSVCFECKKYLCKACKDVHREIKTSEHILHSLDEMCDNVDRIPCMLPPEKVEMCHNHPTKPLEFYCDCEKIMICYDCIIEKHKDHDFDAIYDVKNTLSKALPGIEQLVDEVEKAIANVKGRRKIITTKNEENLKKLDDTFRSLHEALDRHQNELKEKILAQDERLQVQEDELCSLLSQLKSCHSFIADKVQQGVDQDVFTMQKSMLERRDKLEEVKKKTNLCPVKQYPLFIKVVKDIDEKVVNYISQHTE